MFLAFVLCRAPDYCFDEIFCKRCSIYILFRWLNGYFLVTFMTAVLVQRKYLSFLLSNLVFYFGLRKITMAVFPFNKVFRTQPIGKIQEESITFDFKLTFGFLFSICSSNIALRFRIKFYSISRKTKAKVAVTE